VVETVNCVEEASLDVTTLAVHAQFMSGSVNRYWSVIQTDRARR